MNKYHIDDKIMIRLNSENVCRNSGDHLLLPHIQSKNLKILTQPELQLHLLFYLCVRKLGPSHSKGRIKTENVQGQSPEEETVLGG